MDVHASPAELPELKEFLRTFRVRFRRPEREHSLARYLTGLLPELPNQNCDPMAQAIPGTRAQRLQACLTNMPGDEDDLHRQRVQKRMAGATLEALLGDAHRRYAVEPCQEEAQGALGWDPDQGRLWPGFHRQAVTVMLADRCLVWLERCQRRRQPRRGRPRAPFSPSA